MKSRAKAQATLPVEQKSATSLANDLHEERVVDYVGYRFDGHKKHPLIDLVKGDDLKLGDSIFSTEDLKKFHKVLSSSKFKNRKANARRERFELAIASLSVSAIGAAACWGISSILMDAESPGWRLGLLALSFVLGSISMTSLGVFAEASFKDHRWLINEEDVTDIPSLKVRELFRMNGEPYEVNSPTSDELYRAILISNKLSEYVKSTTSTKEQLKSLHEATDGAEELNDQLDSYDALKREEIASYESRIAELLSRGEARTS